MDRLLRIALSLAVGLFISAWTMTYSAQTPIPTETPLLQTPTYAPRATFNPTATHSPALATAVASGECLTSYDTFAYQGPLVDAGYHGDISPILPSWQVEATLPPFEFEGYYPNYFLPQIAFSRVHNQQEIWIEGTVWREGYNDDIPTSKWVITIYRPETQEWEYIESEIEDTGLFVSGLFVMDDGTVWGRTVWDKLVHEPIVSSIPVLSRFNETTRRFEFAEGVLEVPRFEDERYFYGPRLMPDEQGIFWIFVSNDGIYRYDPVSLTTEQRVSLPEFVFHSLALSSDGTIYIKRFSDLVYGGETTFLRNVLGMLYQFIPETNEVLSVDMPDVELPFYNGMLVDHLGGLWLGSILYRESDSDWRILHPHPEEFLEILDNGSFSEIWGPPSPILWTS